LTVASVISRVWSVSIAGKTVLITGAANGIGVASARRLAGAGAGIVLVDVERDKHRALADEIGPEAMAYVADVSDRAGLDAAVAAGVERFGGIDVVIAGAAIDAIGPVAELDDATFTRVIEVNLLGTWRTVRATLPQLRERRGYVLVVSSGSAVVQGPFEAPVQRQQGGCHGIRQHPSP